MKKRKGLVRTINSPISDFSGREVQMAVDAAKRRAEKGIPIDSLRMSRTIHSPLKLFSKKEVKKYAERDKVLRGHGEKLTQRTFEMSDTQFETHVEGLERNKMAEEFGVPKSVLFGDRLVSNDELRARLEKARKAGALGNISKTSLFSLPRKFETWVTKNKAHVSVMAPEIDRISEFKAENLARRVEITKRDSAIDVANKILELAKKEKTEITREAAFLVATRIKKY